MCNQDPVGSADCLVACRSCPALPEGVALHNLEVRMDVPLWLWSNRGDVKSQISFIRACGKASHVTALVPRWYSPLLRWYLLSNVMLYSKA